MTDEPTARLEPAALELTVPPAVGTPGVPERSEAVVTRSEVEATPRKKEPAARAARADPDTEEYAVIEGLVVPPASLATRGATWADMKVCWDIDPDLEPSEAHVRAFRSRSFRKPVQPDEHGAFTLTSVPAEIEVELRAENPFGHDWSARIRLERGERREVVIELELGITIAGRVIDEHGRPVAGIRVVVDEDESPRRSWSSREDDPRPTDAEGRFEMLARRRIVRLRTKGELARHAEAVVDCTAGTVDELVLSVVRGSCIEGTAVWPDGQPVDHFEVIAEGPGGYHREQGMSGRFRLCGLFEGSYQIDLRAQRPDVLGTALLPDVETGGTSFEVVLAESGAFELRGVAVDEQGKPIPSFRIHALMSSAGTRSRSRSTDGKAGEFVLKGLGAGTWNLSASADGHQEVWQRVLVEGPSTPEARFVLPAAGRIRGTVLDPAGAPVEGAWVGDEMDAFAFEFFGPQDHATDASGRFDIEASSTKLRIAALAPGLAVSPVVELDVRPGGSADGVVLRLREPCSVEGRVLDEHGTPLAGAAVTAGGLERDETDAEGAFDLGRLPPGPTRLTAFHPARPGAYPSATATLAPGRSHSIDLRFEAEDPVRLRGRITRGGEPVACFLGLRSRSFGSECASGADGRFEVTLSSPGQWTGFVRLTTDFVEPLALREMDIRRFDFTLPDAELHTLELEVDALPRVTSFDELDR